MKNNQREQQNQQGKGAQQDSPDRQTPHPTQGEEDKECRRQSGDQSEQNNAMVHRFAEGIRKRRRPF